jgi:hypothetical protein
MRSVMDDLVNFLSLVQAYSFHSFLTYIVSGRVSRTTCLVAVPYSQAKKRFSRSHELALG